MTWAVAARMSNHRPRGVTTMDNRTIRQTVCVGLALVAAASTAARAADDTGALPSPKFHHLHLNSVNPDAAISFYTREFHSRSKSQWGGYPALKSPNEQMSRSEKGAGPQQH